MKNKRLIWTLVFLAILTIGSIGTDLFKKEHQDANKVVKVGILQFVTHDALDQIEKGILDWSPSAFRRVILTLSPL